MLLLSVAGDVKLIRELGFPGRPGRDIVGFEDVQKKAKSSDREGLAVPSRPHP